MRKKLLIPLTAALLLAAALAAWATFYRREQREWTTSSPQALAEFRRGVDAERKYYWIEARARYEKALELDPDFTMAALQLMVSEPAKERREKLRARLEKADSRPLTDRERTLLAFGLARQKEAPLPELAKIVDAYLSDHPDDPYVLQIDGDLKWRQRQWEAAEKSYQRLLDLDPNWVDAQNKMGYLSMAQGRFAEAEDRFRTYRYIAPDQANPHDSLGELLVLVGRFDEAQRELESALRLRPDFCSSYANLLASAQLSSRPDLMPEYLRRLDESGCPEETTSTAHCVAQGWSLYVARDWDGLVRMFSEPCGKEHQVPLPWLHVAALLRGDLQAARRMEAFAREDGGPRNPLPPHLQAVREVAEGNLPAALADFAAVDELLEYRQLGDGVFKMYNRLQWAHALELSGDRAGAERLVREVAAVNRAMADRYADLARPRPPAAARGGGPAVRGTPTLAR
jgi:tetratricopeptide (TPR) repeat protein